MNRQYITFNDEDGSVNIRKVNANGYVVRTINSNVVDLDQQTLVDPSELRQVYEFMGVEEEIENPIEYPTYSPSSSPELEKGNPWDLVWWIQGGHIPILLPRSVVESIVSSHYVESSGLVDSDGYTPGRSIGK